LDVKTLKLKFASEASYDILGYTAEELVNLDIKDIYPPESYETAMNLISSKLYEYQETGIEPESQYEIQQYHKDGHLV
jgi:PAS domain S-box-containing protein